MFKDLVQIRFLFAFQNYVQQEKEVGSEVMGLWGLCGFGHVIIEIALKISVIFH